MDFCSPIACCNSSNDDEQEKKDQCMCGFGYLNGGLPIAAVQCFLILGSFLSLAALGDCAFVKIDEELRFDIGPTKNAHNFGYLTFEDAFEGRCYWYDGGGATGQDQVKEYLKFLGHDFNLTRIFAMIGAGGGMLQFLYSISLCCSSQVRRLRYLQFFMVSIVLTLFQGSTLMIFSSDFCAEYTCTFGRSAGFSGAACACYFWAGAMYLTMSDYPGEELDHSNGTTDAHSDSLQDEFMDEKGAGGPYKYEPTQPLPPYPDSISDDTADKTLPTRNITKNASQDIEAPNLSEAPMNSDNASSTPPADDVTTPSATSTSIKDGSSALTNNEPVAPTFTETTAEESTQVQPEEYVVEEEFVDEVVEEEVVIVEDEEIIEEEEVEEEYVEEEVNGGLETVTEEPEPSETKAEAASPLSPVPVKEALGAPQAPPESPIGKEERFPQSAEEVADDASDDPIFEE